jgi:hypothetical protein
MGCANSIFPQKQTLPDRPTDLRTHAQEDEIAPDGEPD